MGGESGKTRDEETKKEEGTGTGGGWMDGWGEREDARRGNKE